MTIIIHTCKIGFVVSLDGKEEWEDISAFNTYEDVVGFLRPIIHENYPKVEWMRPQTKGKEE